MLLLLGLFRGAEGAVSLDGRSSMELAGHLAVLPDPDGAFDIGQVASGRAGPFEPLPGHLTEGFGGRRGVWLRFTVEPFGIASGDWRLRVEPAYLSRVDLYSPTDTGGWEVLHGGNIPHDQRPLPDRASLFPLRVPDEAPRTYYLYVEHGAHLNAYLTLHSPEGLHRVLAVEGVLFGLFFGIVVVLSLINGLNWYVLRERIYLEFAAYLLVRGGYFFSVNGYLGLFFTSLAPETTLYLIRFFLALLAATIAPLLVAVTDMRAVFPRLARFCLGLGAFAGLLAVPMLFGLLERAVVLLLLVALFVPLAGLATAVMQVRRKGRQAWLLMTIMLVFLSGSATSILGALGLQVGMIPALYGVQISLSITFILLHISVAGRVKEIREAKEESERAARVATRQAAEESAARREQADFVGMLFHEIKTPLAVIDSAATVLEYLDDGSRAETERRYDAIHGAVERLNRLVEHSLSRERQGLNEVHLKPVAVDLKREVVAVLESYRSVATQRLELEAAGDLPVIRGDVELLRACVTNLVDNATKYSPAGTTVRLQLRRRGRGIELHVVDEGQGMEQDETMFDRFKRGPRVAGVPGAGLGLYLVKRIVEAHAGTIAVDSAPGRGTHFTVVLPEGAA